MLGERLASALEDAFRLHQLDMRKGTAIPNISHLMAVAALVLESGGDEDEAIAALLRDAAEDHGGERRLAVIADRFGDRVAMLVKALSDTVTDDKEDKEEWRPRKERYLAHLRAENDPAILRISRADKLHNARAILRDYLVESDGLRATLRVELKRADELLGHLAPTGGRSLGPVPGARARRTCFDVRTGPVDAAVRVPPALARDTAQASARAGTRVPYVSRTRTFGWQGDGAIVGPLIGWPSDSPAPMSASPGALLRRGGCLANGGVGSATWRRQPASWSSPAVVVVVVMRAAWT